MKFVDSFAQIDKLDSGGTVRFATPPTMSAGTAILKVKE